MSEPIEVHDSLNHWRCPQLGGPVPFRHCRRSGDDMLPCRKLPECWGSQIDVPGFIAAAYTPEEIEKAFGGPAKTRMDIIFDALNTKDNSKEN